MTRWSSIVGIHGSIKLFLGWEGEKVFGRHPTATAKLLFLHSPATLSRPGFGVRPAETFPGLGAA